MKITNKVKKNLIIIFSAVILIAVVLFGVIIWQTVKVNELNSEINNLDGQIAETNSQIAKQESQIEYYESEDFKEDYTKYELGYSETKNTIYK